MNETTAPTRPRTLTCAGCKQTHDLWVFNPATVDADDDCCLEAPGWDWDGEWWIDPADPHHEDLWSYCCSRFCYVTRLKELKNA